MLWEDVTTILTSLVNSNKDTQTLMSIFYIGEWWTIFKLRL